MNNIILATDELGSIGFSSGKLPWHIPEDLKIFKNKTLNSHILYGKNTYNSIKSFFPNGFPSRTNYVLTNNKIDNEKIISINDINYFLNLEYDNKWIAGGAYVYDNIFLNKELLSKINEVHITCIKNKNVNSDIRLNSINTINFDILLNTYFEIISIDDYNEFKIIIFKNINK